MNKTPDLEGQEQFWLKQWIYRCDGITFDQITALKKKLNKINDAPREAARVHGLIPVEPKLDPGYPTVTQTAV